MKTLFDLQPGDSITTPQVRPGVIHKVRFATPSSVRTMCWLWATEDNQAARVEEAPNCLQCLTEG